MTTFKIRAIINPVATFIPLALSEVPSFPRGLMISLLPDFAGQAEGAGGNANTLKAKYARMA